MRLGLCAGIAIVLSVACTGGPGASLATQTPSASPGSTTPPANSPTAAAASPTSTTPRVTLDRQSVGLDQLFTFCFDGFGTITTQERVRFVYPDGFEQRLNVARVYDPPARCREFGFDSTSPWAPGPYTFDWIINGQPISFTVTLAFPSASPTPSSRSSVSASAALTPTPTSSPIGAAPVPSAVATPTVQPTSAPPSPVRTAVPFGTLALPAFITLDLGDGVSTSDDVDAIVDGLARAQAFYMAQVGPNPIASEVVKVYLLAPGQDPGCCTGYPGRPERIEIRVNHPEWIQSRDRRLPMHLLRQLTMAHEHWHLWQHAMGCPSQNYLQPIWPVWMTEGGAEFMQWQVLIGSGLVANSALATFEQGMIDEATQQGPVTLQSFEAMQYGDRRGYALGYFGTKRLVARAGYGALRVFCGNLAAGVPWRAAFTASFGIAPDAFYADFESWRANGYK